MPAEELSQKYFSRERVRNRMLRRAAELWGFSESEMNDFDPLVSLLIEACAMEFEKISAEISKTQNRMLGRLAQLLNPRILAIRPAYGIIQVRSSEASGTLYPDEQFVCRSATPERKREDQAEELFFSPCTPTKIFDAKIRYTATSQELFEWEDGVQKYPVTSSSRKAPEWQQSVWLGIDLADGVTSLRDLRFFFNWINQPESESWYQFLPYTHWYAGNVSLQHKQGLDPGAPGESSLQQLDSEYDAMAVMENLVREIFSPHYITIATGETLEQMKIDRVVYPKVFESLFEPKDLKELKDPLLWVRIEFPTAIPPDALENIFCSLNAVPVLNRKLNRFTYKLLQNLNIVPLETEGSFLSIREINNSLGKQVKLVPFANPGTLAPETYTLRYGVNRFDERNSGEALVNLTELIREESSYFSSLGQDFLIQHIRDLNQILARIEDKIKLQNRSQSPYPYLIIRPQREGSNVMIEYWSCNGESANKIPLGTKLSPYRHSNVKPNSIYFITSTFGGRDKLSDAEKIDEYKKSLLTHERIVTLQDLKQHVETELGSAAVRVEYRKNYIKGAAPEEGFIECMEILITPRPGGLDMPEWKQRLEELRIALEKKSASHVPYVLTISTP